MGSTDLKTFDIAPFLHELSTNIVHGGGASEVDLSVQAIPLDAACDFAIPLGLLVNELVTNSLKHAFPGRPGRDRRQSQPGRRTGPAAGRRRQRQGLQPRGRWRRFRGEPPARMALGSTIIEGLVAQLERYDYGSEPPGRDPQRNPRRRTGGRMSAALNPRVLVVDDEFLIAQGLCMQVEDMQIEVCGTATTADEAVALASDAQPEVVLMDVRLHGENGRRRRRPGHPRHRGVQGDLHHRLARAGHDRADLPGPPRRRAVQAGFGPVGCAWRSARRWAG